MPQKIRNHYVPRFLLNRFASWAEPENDKFKIWVLSKNEIPGERSTKDVAVKKKLYGEDSDIEDKFSKMEGEWAAIFRKISEDVSPNFFSENLSDLVWLQAWRTRAVRIRLQNTISELLIEMRDQVYRSDFMEKLLPQLRNKIWNQIFSLDLENWLEGQNNSRAIGLFTAVEVRIILYVASGEIQKQIYNIMNIILNSDNINDLVKNSLNKTISEMMDEEDRTSAWKIERWTCWWYPSGRLIMGDCGIICAKFDGSFGPVRDAKNWDYVILPIDPYRCIVGYRHTLPDKIEHEDLNLLTAKSSVNEIFCSYYDKTNSDLINQIGKSTALLEEEELLNIMENMWNHSKL